MIGAGLVRWCTRAASAHIGIMVTPEDLVAGPRGRRVLLVFAQGSERALAAGDTELPLTAAVFDAAFGLATQHGHPVSRFGRDDSHTRPEYTAAEVAARLAEVRLAPVTGDLVLEALAMSVGAAMYWQQADGDDLLCATPQVRASLVRVAEHLAGSPGLQGWAAPIDPADQWQLAWDAEKPCRRPDLRRWRAEITANEVTAQRERPADPRANWSGQWWSHPPRGLACSTGSLADGSRSGCGSSRTPPAGRTRTRTVSGSPRRPGSRDRRHRRLGRLCAQFPLEVTALKRHDWYRTTGRDGSWVIPDWSQVAHDYDGVHLSIAGYLTAATTHTFAVDHRSCVSPICTGCIGVLGGALGRGGRSEAGQQVAVGDRDWRGPRAGVALGVGLGWRAGCRQRG